MALSGCGAGGGESGSAESSSPAAAATQAGSFPVTVRHAFGETVIEKKPERVATVAWANHEVPLALGVVPVGMSKATWGDDDRNGILPWVQTKLNDLGGTTPVLFDETDGIDFEAVSNTNPDVILAAYSGLTKQEYETLSKIAPVVAYPKTAWGTTMEEMITLNSRALGLGEQGERLNGDLKTRISESAAKYPALKGEAALFANVDPKDLSKVGFYTPVDPRAGFLNQFGLTTPKAVKTTKSTTFNGEVSAERSDTLSDVDLIVTYADDPTSVVKRLQADPLISKVPAVKNGAVAVLKNDTPLAAAANPSPLSISWGVDDYLKLLNTAATKGK